ncbi:DUF4124 domain-containing protein [Microbulbifer sp. EKSA005]|uniref:DUF4124 domain-containing protein n=1 Tax=Microbulbifer sp. EKSA005 TaxID=3243364 RepID=UPI0040437C4E
MRYIAILVLFLIGQAEAAIYKCTDESGKVSFQEQECTTKSKEKLSIKHKRESNYNHSMWIEPNYVDTAYSALFQNVSIYEFQGNDSILKYMPFGWKPYRVNGKVLEVYKGDLSIGDTASVIVYLRPPYDRKQIFSNKYILSFCKSKSGVFFVGNDFQTQKATSGNIRKFQDIKEYGTDYKGDGKCITNWPSFNPDKHN